MHWTQICYYYSPAYHGKAIVNRHSFIQLQFPDAAHASMRSPLQPQRSPTAISHQTKATRSRCKRYNVIVGRNKLGCRTVLLNGASNWYSSGSFHIEHLLESRCPPLCSRETFIWLIGTWRKCCESLTILDRLQNGLLVWGVVSGLVWLDVKYSLRECFLHKRVKERR